MMAAEHHFIYRGGGRDVVIPRNATHVIIHESVTVIPAWLCKEHPNIVELICHISVKRIEQYAFTRCPRLRRVIIPGVEVVERDAFTGCKAVNYIDCDKLERVGEGAFHGCKSLGNINLPSAIRVERWAFNNSEALMNAKFGKNLESISGAFLSCPSLERITIPLKNGLSAHDGIFTGCINLKFVDLFEEEALYKTANALLLEEWRNDMNETIDSINQSLPNADPGEVHHYDGEKAFVIREWIARVLRKIIHYKAEHRHVLNKAASTLQLMLSNDIVTSNVLPFLELPSHTFHGENQELEIMSNTQWQNLQHVCKGR